MIELLESKGIKALFPIQYRTFDAILAGLDIKAKDKTAILYLKIDEYNMIYSELVKIG